jgi:subtilase family serine protease
LFFLVVKKKTAYASRQGGTSVQRKIKLTTWLIAPVILVLVSSVAAQSHGNGKVIVPDSTVEHPTDMGARAHTNHLVLIPANAGPRFVGSHPAGETPLSIRSLYNLGSSVSFGGARVIAIVDAFHYATAENDLGVFSSQFGLPACTTANGCFKVVFASGTQPRKNCGWAQEAALDIEWAHALAPNAKIVLVEAASNSFANLFTAVDVATSAVANGGGGEVSMSWGGSEFSSEASSDSHFQNTGVVYFASSGDTGGATIYPSASPYVVAAGGTTIHRDALGNFVSETGWNGSGGGPSKYEAKPAYQNSVGGTDASQRSIPDLSFDADPNSGVSVYDSTSCQGNSGWLVFGGTSVSSPSLAGIVNSAGGFASSSADELNTIYSNYTNTNDYRDILSGSAGSFTAGPGWDFVTGVGSDLGYVGK